MLVMAAPLWLLAAEHPDKNNSNRREQFTISVTNRLKVSDNRRYLVDAKTGAPVFILADTAWNLGALKRQKWRNI